MKKFRIVEIEKTNGKGESTTHYRIKKRFLFWFFDYSIKNYLVRYIYEHKTHSAILSKRIFAFNSQIEAEECLNKTTNQFKEKYKGNNIIKTFNGNSKSEIFINKSCWNFYFERNSFPRLVYEYSYSISELKDRIDGRTSKTKVTVL